MQEVDAAEAGQHGAAAAAAVKDEGGDDEETEAGAKMLVQPGYDRIANPKDAGWRQVLEERKQRARHKPKEEVKLTSKRMPKRVSKHSPRHTHNQVYGGCNGAATSHHEQQSLVELSPRHPLSSGKPTPPTPGPYITAKLPLYPSM